LADVLAPVLVAFWPAGSLSTLNQKIKWLDFKIRKKSEN